MEKFYFVMPAYNESANIVETVKQWYPVVEKINGIDGCEAMLTIANDGSKDDTYQVMMDLKSGGHFHSLSQSTKKMEVMVRPYFSYIAMP